MAPLFLPARALRRWPHPDRTDDRHRTSGGFQVTEGAALTDLERECGRHGFLSGWLELELSERDLTHAGRLRSDARVLFPGVALIVEHPVRGTLVFACDRYSQWHRNVRGIELTLKGLRDIDRHGAVVNGAQYEGFRMIPARTGLTMGLSAALEILAKESGQARTTGVDVDPVWLADAVKRARKFTHPDTGADRVRWDAVESAARVVQALFPSVVL